jgi:hypothetical protein
MLRLLGLNTDNVKTFSQTLESLDEKDELVKLKDMKLEQPLIRMVIIADKYGLTETRLMNLSQEEMIQALNGINYDIDITPLTVEHSRVTFAYIVDHLDKMDDKSLLKKLMNSLSHRDISYERL